MIELYKLYYAELIYYGLKFLPYQKDHVNDIVVSAIIKVSKTTYEDKRAALYKTVKNLCLNQLKLKKYTITDEIPDNESFESDYENMLIEIDVLKILLRSYNELPEISRAVIQKMYYENKTANETARDLNKSASTIRTIHQFALDKLFILMRKKMNPEFRKLLNINTTYERQHAK